jgi:hypothetical protein
MNCPKCKYPNPQGVTYCQMCYEVFNRSAADRYYHAQRRARREREGNHSDPKPDPTPMSTPSSPPPPVLEIISESLPKIDWGNLIQKGFDAVFNFGLTGFHLVQTYPKEIGLAAGIVILGVITVFYSSPIRRMQIFGNHLEYHMRSKAMVGYLVDFHTEVKSWSERGGRLDTPLDHIVKDEMGSVDIKASNLKLDLEASPFHQKTQSISIRPREWILTQEGALSQTIPLNHPSLKASRIVLNQSGVILKRENNFSVRLGRSVNFLMPHWPAGVHRTGDTWEEPVGWVETLADWKIFWRGRLHWTIAGYEVLADRPLIQLHYTAEMSPALWEVPAWAKGVVRSASFSGTSEGDLLFNEQTHEVFSNVFTQEGALTLPISDIYRIPMEQRVGRLPRHRWGQSVEPVPGTIVLQIKDKVDVRKR